MSFGKPEKPRLHLLAPAVPFEPPTRRAIAAPKSSLSGSACPISGQPVDLSEPISESACRRSGYQSAILRADAPSLYAIGHSVSPFGYSSARRPAAKRGESTDYADYTEGRAKGQVEYRRSLSSNPCNLYYKSGVSLQGAKKSEFNTEFTEVPQRLRENKRFGPCPEKSGHHTPVLGKGELRAPLWPPC
jgi:hypothetical protein